MRGSRQGCREATRAQLDGRDPEGGGREQGGGARPQGLPGDPRREGPRWLENILPSWNEWRGFLSPYSRPGSKS